MQKFEDISQYSPKKGLCLTIGNFDGLHLGHQELIKRTQQIAREKDLDFAVMTFWPHPRTVVASAKAHLPLTDRAERLRLLEALGVPMLFELPFNTSLANLSARDFVKQVLKPLSLSQLVIGHDFRMGHKREASTEELKKLGDEYGFEVEQIPALSMDGLAVSSSRLRAAIAQGNVESAQTLLGRPYALNGKIVSGDARGRTLGFPTANLGQIQTLLPALGIYACLAHIDESILPAAVSVGTNPTFDGHKITVESFLLEGGRDLYNQPMRLEFIARLREQRKFPSAEALAQQISLDVEKTKEILTDWGKKFDHR